VSFDVFISYASKDKIVADAVCARLEAAGIRCWIAPRDIVAGTSYGEAIIDAIHGAKVMVLVFSSSANASGHIPKEVERAVSNGVAILPFRIEDVAPGKSLDYFIGSVHWLDAMTPPMEQHLDSLAATVQKLIPSNVGGANDRRVIGGPVGCYGDVAARRRGCGCGGCGGEDDADDGRDGDAVRGCWRERRRIIGEKDLDWSCGGGGAGRGCYANDVDAQRRELGKRVDSYAGRD
jgi:hypothetical protein